MISPFNKINLAEEDELRGLVLSTLQKQVLSNRMAELAKEIIDIPLFEIDRNQYFERLSYQKGQYAEIEAMLDASDKAEITLNATKE